MRYIFESKLHVCAVSAVVWLGGVTVARADINPHQVLNAIYKDGFNKKDQCWRAFDESSNQAYCMKIDSARTVNASSGQRFYLLVAGMAVDETGEPNGTHATSGMVGAFVIEDQNGRPNILAADPLLQIGARGEAPTGWKLVQLGPLDYWGWQNESSDCHQGYCGTSVALLAPYGRGIKDLAGFVSSYSNGDACFTNTCKKQASDLHSSLEINAAVNDVKVYPLIVTVKGIDEGRKIKLRRYVLPFDAGKWAYKIPSNWIFRDAEF